MVSLCNIYLLYCLNSSWFANDMFSKWIDTFTCVVDSMKVTLDPYLSLETIFLVIRFQVVKEIAKLRFFSRWRTQCSTSLIDYVAQVTWLRRLGIEKHLFQDGFFKIIKRYGFFGMWSSLTLLYEWVEEKDKNSIYTVANNMIIYQMKEILHWEKTMVLIKCLFKNMTFLYIKIKNLII